MSYISGALKSGSFGSNSQIFIINSRDRISGTDSDFVYKLDLLPDNNYDTICCLQAIIPKSYYLVDTNRNTFTLDEDGDQVEISVDIGNYSQKSFANRITTLLNENSPNNWVYSITYPTSNSLPRTGLYTFDVSGNSSQPSLIFDDFLYEPFGFNPNSTNTFVANILVSGNVINLQSEDALFICSDCVDNQSDGILQEILASNNPDFSEISFKNHAVEAYSKKFNGKSSIRIYLTNENKVPMILNGLNMVMAIVCYQRENVFDQIKSFIKVALEYINQQKTKT